MKYLCLLPPLQAPAQEVACGCFCTCDDEDHLPAHAWYRQRPTAEVAAALAAQRSSSPSSWSSSSSRSATVTPEPATPAGSAEDLTMIDITIQDDDRVGRHLSRTADNDENLPAAHGEKQARGEKRSSEEKRARVDASTEQAEAAHTWASVNTVACIHPKPSPKELSFETHMCGLYPAFAYAPLYFDDASMLLDPVDGAWNEALNESAGLLPPLDDDDFFPAPFVGKVPQ